MSNNRDFIIQTILDMDKPFPISELFHKFQCKKITEKQLVLDILHQLLDSGLVEFSEIIDDMAIYQLSQTAVS